MGDLKTVLMLSRFFPPGYEIGGKRAYRFARYLPDYGWRAAIVTDIAPHGARADDSAGLPLPEVHSVHRGWYPEGWRRPKAADSDGTSTAPTKPRKVPPEELLERIEWHLQMPLGREITLTSWGGRLTRRVAEREQADAIFATSSPYTALVWGAVAKSLTGLPLHLDLRDPWSMNFLQRTKSPWTRWSERRLEAAVLRRADRITFTCDAAAEAYRERYPAIAPRVARIYNSFDPAQRPAAVSKRSGPLELVHFGNCYGIRRLETVLRAAARLRDEMGLTPDALKIVNLGRMAQADLDLIVDLRLEGFVEARPVMPYEEGLAKLAGCDLQLLLAYGEERLFIPAKLFDYLLTGAPILCVAPESELTRIVSRTGAGVSVRPGAVDAAAEAIRAALAARREGRAMTVRDEEAIEAFSAPTTARELAGMLDEMIASRRT